MGVAHTPGPWPIDFTGDDKRIIVGPGLVEGPNGYDVAEVYADDCDREEAEGNARVIAAAPDMVKALEAADRHLSRVRDLNFDIVSAINAIRDGLAGVRNP